MEVHALFAVAAAVLTISALLAGFVARAPLSFPIIFLALGLVLGVGTTGAVSVDLESDLLLAVAFATLALVPLPGAVEEAGAEAAVFAGVVVLVVAVTVAAGAQAARLRAASRPTITVRTGR